jgi:glycosyltransferase involved in cell wall biosynthesis
MSHSNSVQPNVTNGSMVSSDLARAASNVGKPWRILHTESSMEMGGQEYRVLEEALGMANRGHEVIVAVPQGSQMASLAQKKELPIELTASGKTAWINLVTIYLRIIRHHRIEIVNTHGSLDSWTASVAGRLSPLKPIIIRTRHKSTPISQTWRHQWLYKYLPHGVMTTSERIRKEMITRQTLDPTRTLSVPTGVNLGIFDATNTQEDLRKEFGIGKESIVLGTVAFLRDYKGIHLCLDAVALLRHQFPTLKFLVVGDGPEGLRLREKAESLGIQNYVHFVGFRSDVHRVLAALDVFVLPSTAGEGVPQAITQAMAMGVPVVATSIGGIPEVVIHEETGMLVPVNNVEALTHCIRDLLKDASLCAKIVAKAQALVAQSYSLEVMLDAVEQFYGEMLRNTHDPQVGRVALN